LLESRTYGIGNFAYKLVIATEISDLKCPWAAQLWPKTA